MKNKEKELLRQLEEYRIVVNSLKKDYNTKQALIKKKILDEIDKRILELEEFDGLAECELQKAELQNVRQIIIKEFGDLENGK